MKDTAPRERHYEPLPVGGSLGVAVQGNWLMGPGRLPAAGSRRHVPASRAIEGTQNEETDHCDGYWRRTCRRRNRSRGTGKRSWALWRRGRVGQRRGPLRLRPTPGWQLHPLRHCVRARFRRHELLSGVPPTTGRHSAGSVRIGIAPLVQSLAQPGMCAATRNAVTTRPARPPRMTCDLLLDTER